MTLAAEEEAVLLTGLPSFAARKMCEELVRYGPRVVVHAVVRSRSDARDTLDELTPNERTRVCLVEGDPAAIDFGLSGPEFKSITAQIDRIHHMADASPAFADRTPAEVVNLRGARELLEVAAACPALKCAVFHSTAHVAGDRTGLLLESELDKGQAFRNPTEETLARGEKMMRAAMKRLPIAVVRPTFIVGDATTGEVERESAAYVLLTTLLGLPSDAPIPSPGRSETPLHFVPVDYYVRAARAIGGDLRAPGRTFHLGDPAPPSAKRVFERIVASGERRAPLGFLPSHLAKALRHAPGIDRLFKGPRGVFDMLAAPVVYSFANTTELLEGTGITCPTLDSYLDALVDRVKQRSRRGAEEPLSPSPIL